VICSIDEYEEEKVPEQEKLLVVEQDKQKQKQVE